MKKIIILLLCCGMLVSMVGCGGNTAPPPTKSPSTTVSEMVITETTPPTTAVEPTEEENETTPTENKDQATEPTVTATEPTTVKPKEESNPTVMTKPTESSAAENTKENGCITIVETDEPPTEEIIIPPKPSADLVAQKVAGYINHLRRKGSSLRGGDRTELDGNDIYAESADKIATGYSEHSAYADDRGRTESIYGSAAEGADAVHRADQRSDRTVPDGDGNIGGGIEQKYQSADNGYRETGWENERELFEQHLYASQYSGGQAGEAYEQTVLDITDPFGSAHSVGTDTAYLIGDIGNIIDEDAPVEDCTTMQQPRRQKKNTGPVMGGM